MIKGIGVDLCETSRMEQLLKKEQSRLKGRVFHEEEWQEDVFSLAARWAAKEAFAKALGTGLRGFSYIDVYVHVEESGKPILKVTDKALEIFNSLGGGRLHLSLSHEKSVAIAMVVWETE